jgi:hypothetical protein
LTPVGGVVRAYRQRRAVMRWKIRLVCIDCA